MKWVTRKSIRVNRTATAWLIRRFVDPHAEFFFVDADRVAECEKREGAIGFDAPGARYPHEDARGRCSFEALVEEHQPDDAALRELARIVHGADFADAVSLTPESSGLRTLATTTRPWRGHRSSTIRSTPRCARDSERALESRGSRDCSLGARTPCAGPHAEARRRGRVRE